MTAVDKVDAVDSRVDARVHHRPEDAARLVMEACNAAGSQAEVTARCGVSRDYLRKLRRGELTMSYPLQVTLELIAGE